MIEIRITVDAALSLLTDRMKYELKNRQKAGLIPQGYRFENLSYKELWNIVEAALFDTLFLLPFDLLTQETNLEPIVTKTVQALVKAVNREEFILWSPKNTKAIIGPIEKFMKAAVDKPEFFTN